MWERVQAVRAQREAKQREREEAFKLATQVCSLRLGRSVSTTKNACLMSGQYLIALGASSMCISSAPGLGSHRAIEAELDLI
jgi:hypothetical protein